MVNKKNRYQITISDMAPHVHNFLPNENKTEKILNWLKNWILLSLECNKIKPDDLLPSKADLACHIGVSQGTIQNVFRLLEDDEFVESKQRIGTYIKNKGKNIKTAKLTSKKELATQVIKKYIIENNYKKDDTLISIRKLSSITGITNTTLRSAIINLTTTGILKKERNNFIINKVDFNIEKIHQETLAEKITTGLRKYIQNSFKTGDRLPSCIELSKKFNVSVKTINDAIKTLNKEGLICTKRGKYGSFVADKNSPRIPYFYEKFEVKIKQYISENCQIGDKLPPIKELSKVYNTSEKTIKRALDNLAEDGYLTYSRGRTGGTFITDIPQTGEAYKWIAINADYVNN